MKTITIGARISEGLDRDLRMLAVATGRSKSWLVAEALKSYVEAEKEFLEAVEEGIRAADEGRFVDHDAVAAEFERRYRSR
ncbi:MAG: CopG family ribbon-helix-helix protein [Geminicoccales bacterium]